MHRNIRALAAIPILVVGLLAVFVSPAAADETQDAACVAPGAVFITNINPGNFRVAETFTALNTGALTRAQITISKTAASSGDFVLDIHSLDGSDSPTDPPLAATTIGNDSVADGTSNLTGSFSAPASVVAGQRYALGLSRPGGGNWAVQASSTNPCPDGQMFNSSGGGPWNPMPSTDPTFAVFVTPPEAAPAPPLVVAAVPPTGQRTAALKRCKRKFKDDREKRRKCRRRAKRLPV